MRFRSRVTTRQRKQHHPGLGAEQQEAPLIRTYLRIASHSAQTTNDSSQLGNERQTQNASGHAYPPALRSPPGPPARRARSPARTASASACSAIRPDGSRPRGAGSRPMAARCSAPPRCGPLPPPCVCFIDAEPLRRAAGSGQPAAALRQLSGSGLTRG